MAIIIKSRRELEMMRRTGKVGRDILNLLSTMVKPGMNTWDLNEVARVELDKVGAIGTSKHYPTYKAGEGFPSEMCISTNEEVVHGIPSPRALIEGDIISIDMGAKLDGFYGDSAVTVPVGAVSAEAQRLLDVTRTALDRAVAAVKAGARVSDIGAAVQSYVEAQGFSVVREFVGHGIGTSLHEEPQIPNYGTAGRGPRLAEGMALAIEPMVNAGKPAVKVLGDGWTAVTKDKALSAHFEHTVVVTEHGCRVLTLPPDAVFEDRVSA